MKRIADLRHDERGEITIVGWVVIATIAFVGPTIIVGVGSLFGDDDNRSTAATPSFESPVLPGPAPPENDCARDAYQGFGLEWNGAGGPGWTVPGTVPPVPGDANFQQEMRNYKAIVAARVVDAVSLWTERGCHQIRKTDVPSPDPEPSPTASPPPSIAGTYQIEEDVSRRATGAAAADDPLGCAARRVPPEMTVGGGGTSTSISINLVDTPGSSAFTSTGTFDPSTGSFAIDYPDASGRYLQGRFVLFGDRLLLSDGQMFSGECTFFFQGTKV